MAQRDSAFITVSCVCPICSKESRHRYIKSKLFKSGEIEDDQHTVDYQWENAQFEGIRPNFYHIWHCPFCHYSDEKEAFRGEDKSHGQLELIREKILIATRAPLSVLVRIGKWVDLDKEYIALDSALTAHLLALFVQLMLSPNRRQDAKIARFYLRIAWLYREKETWAIPEINVPDGFRNYSEFLDSLRDAWSEIPLSENHAMEIAIEHYQKDLDRTGRVDDIRHEVTIMLLMTALFTRTNRRADALLYLQQIFQRATQKRQSAQQALSGGVKRGKLSNKQIEAMRSLVNWLSLRIDQAKDQATIIQNAIFDDEYPAAREKVLGLTAPNLKEIVQLLKAEGFHPVTQRRIATMFQKKALQPDTGETTESDTSDSDGSKKGFWGSLIEKIKGDEEE